MDAWRQPPIDVAAKLLARARRRGPGDIARLGWDRFRGGLSSRGEIVFLWRPCTRAPVDPPDGMTIRPAVAGDADTYERDVGSESAGTFRRRLARGGTCVLAVEQGAIRHSSWLARGPVWTRELRAFVGPPVGDAYVYESFTAPAARGRGVYPKVLLTACFFLAEKGVERLWVGVEAENEPSLRAVAKAGFEESFRVSFRRRLGLLVRDEPAGLGAATAPEMLGAG